MLLPELPEEPIHTDYDPKPGRDRRFDWAAIRGDYDLGHAIGFGRTETEAIADLIELEEFNNDKTD